MNFPVSATAQVGQIGKYFVLQFIDTGATFTQTYWIPDTLYKVNQVTISGYVDTVKGSACTHRFSTKNDVFRFYNFNYVSHLEIDNYSFYDNHNFNELYLLPGVEYYWYNFSSLGGAITTNWQIKEIEPIIATEEEKLMVPCDLWSWIKGECVHGSIG